MQLLQSERSFCRGGEGGARLFYTWRPDGGNDVRLCDRNSFRYGNWPRQPLPLQQMDAEWHQHAHTPRQGFAVDFDRDQSVEGLTFP